MECENTIPNADAVVIELHVAPSVALNHSGFRLSEVNRGIVHASLVLQRSKIKDQELKIKVQELKIKHQTLKIKYQFSYFVLSLGESNNAQTGYCIPGQLTGKWKHGNE